MVSGHGLFSIGHGCNNLSLFIEIKRDRNSMEGAKRVRNVPRQDGSESCSSELSLNENGDLNQVRIKYY